MHNQVPWEGMNHYMPQNLSSTRSRTTSNVHPALFPARRPSTVHSPDLFFAAPPTLPPPPLPPAPHPNRHTRPTTAPSGPHPPTYRPPTDNHAFHRSYTCPPPIPPKPSELQSMKPDSEPAPPAFPEPPPEEVKEIRSEEDELALALEISRSESKKQQPIISQEDEDLARALQESLKLADTNGTLMAPLHIPASSGEGQSTDVSSVVPRMFEEEEEEQKTPVQSSSADPIPSPQTPTSDSTRLTLGSIDDGKSGVTSKSDPIGHSFIDFGGPSDYYVQDEALARSLAADYPVTPAVNPCADDETLARRLAQEEGSAPGPSVNKDVAQMRRNDVPSSSNGQLRAVSTFVAESDDRRKRAIMRGLDASLRGRSKSAMATLNTTRLPDIQDMPPPYEPSSLASSTETPSTTSTVSSPHESPATEESSLNRPSIPRVNSSPTLTIPQSNVSGSSQRLTPSPTASTSQPSLTSPSNHTYLAARNTQITDLSEEFDHEPAPSPSTPSASSNPYISDDLLNGVSIGFDPPPMSAQLGTWNKALPTIISLPFGRSVPLHVQAPSWRHVLKLLARLPGTSIQPTIEALAETKMEHKLRTVIQFAKPHLASTEWRVILWFTLEHPVPSNVPGSTRYANDVNVLPWSYTFSQPPQLLRGGSDSQLAKAYTIPVTNSLSFPKLPITCPDLAMYLHAAMEVSRRHINDSSSGVRKLAKMIDFCYPNANADETANTERRGVGNLFKRVIGRNNNRKRGGNEDTYDLVTPFVADEWG